ncbi:hypothetical protein NX801_12750 [Streptomyces sp. LP05-1]|uniref:Lipoprotein n=1 Tax=Streptomyces pyxinae TaxID=2970734 RepID=A0ABT2CGH6_9ACTN|nr:hypothetical protein [Streptomyces sp. LP05-1]MCS0636517.1 hypothetical protein [Streptomyces sp. LP05-1]
MGRTDTTRRRALATSGAATAGLVALPGLSLLLTGCSADDGADAARDRAAAARAAAAETALRRRSAAVSGGLLARYDAVLAAHPPLAARLNPLRAAVAEHVAALGPVAAASEAPAPAGPPSPARATGTPPPGSRPPEPAPAATTVPAAPEAALTGLADAVRRASDAHAAALTDAPPEYARLLASVAAAGAVHAYLLTAPAEGNGS